MYKFYKEELYLLAEFGILRYTGRMGTFRLAECIIRNHGFTALLAF